MIIPITLSFDPSEKEIKYSRKNKEEKIKAKKRTFFIWNIVSP
tara:strand:- start:12689 stop:12817 length:129 start_codon:yes stop_codon:yes gene_type:complete